MTTKKNAARSTLLAAATGSEKPFTERLEEMDRYELMRRCTNQASTIAAYQQCLDGLNIYAKTGLGGLDNHRRPDDIRDIVERLLSPNAQAEARESSRVASSGLMGGRATPTGE